jgi:hypothetical protein
MDSEVDRVRRNLTVEPQFVDAAARSSAQGGERIPPDTAFHLFSPLKPATTKSSEIAPPARLRIATCRRESWEVASVLSQWFVKQVARP